MNKILGLALVAIIGYAFFIKDGSPDAIFLNGQEYGPRVVEKSNDSNSTLYRYSNKSINNNDYVMILYPDSGTGDLDAWSNLFSRLFTSQGFNFETSGYGKIGSKDKSRIYMVPVYTKDVLAIYMLEDIGNTDLPKGNGTILTLNNMRFE